MQTKKVSNMSMHTMYVWGDFVGPVNPDKRVNLVLGFTFVGINIIDNRSPIYKG